jgi:hypothetical protein
MLIAFKVGVGVCACWKSLPVARRSLLAGRLWLSCNGGRSRGAVAISSAVVASEARETCLASMRARRSKLCVYNMYYVLYLSVNSFALLIVLLSLFLSQSLKVSSSAGTKAWEMA